MRIHRSFDDAPLIAARLLFPSLTDAEIISKALAQLAGIAELPPSAERQKSGQQKGGEARGKQITAASARRAIRRSRDGAAGRLEA